MRKLTYFIAASIDGFIGAPGGNAEFFTRFVDEEFFEYLKTEYPETLPTHGRKALGLDDLENQRFDTVIQGRASYQLALDGNVTSPYAHLRQYVASRTIDQSPDPAVEIVSDDLVGKVRELKQEEGLDIYLCGGSKLAGELLRFFWERKWWWLSPMILMLLFFAGLMIFAQSSAIAPFIYTLF